MKNTFMESVMKKILLTTLIGLLSFGSLVSEAKTDYQIIEKSLQKLCPDSKAIFLIKYPQLKNLKNSITQTKINKILDKNFTEYKNAKCSDFVNNESYQEETEFKTKLQKENILSIYYFNSGYVKGAAHPSNVISAYNFNTKTGTLLSLKDIFKTNTNFRNKIKALIVKDLNKNNLPVYAADKNEYEFYLTNNSLVIINLFDNHAFQSYETIINYKDIRDMINQIYSNTWK